MAKKQKLPETFDSSFAGIPHVVLDSNAFTGASNSAKALLFAIIRQHNGRNNGHFQLTQPWLSKQGYSSSSIYRARDELINRGLLIQTKYGGLNMGANLYAVSWHIVSNFVGLDIKSFERGSWARCELEKTNKRKPPNSKRQERYDYKSSNATNIVAISTPSVTNIVAKPSTSYRNNATTIVNNVFNTNTLIKFKRIVGKKGRSGKIKYIRYDPIKDQGIAYG